MASRFKFTIIAAIFAILWWLAVNYL